MRARPVRLLACLAALLAAPAAAAPPSAPLAIPYQGVLLDAGGSPQSGTVDLTLRLFDATSGGTLLYKQVFPAVPLSDGVFSVTLGPIGSASDTPVNPLTTSLSAALAGDLPATGPSRFLEITAGSSGPLARTQVLSVPYTLRATQAERADVATTADDATSVEGVPSEAFAEIFEHVNFDGGGPPNTDPLEGVGDVDGDGVANFIDPDNDGDGISDSTELSQGSGINLVTPVVTSVSPPVVVSFASTAVTVFGQNFQGGLDVVFGSQNPTPTSITATSFQIVVGPQSPGPANVTVTLPNGESDSLAVAGFFNFPSGLAHGLSVTQFGQLALDLTGGGLPVIGGPGGYTTNFDLDGDFEVQTFSTAGSLAMAFDAAAQLAGLRCRNSGGFTCQVELARDVDGDRVLEGSEATQLDSVTNGVGSGAIHGASLAFDPAGHPVAGYVKFDAVRSVRVARDLDGDGTFTGTGEIVDVGTVAGSQANGGDLAVDSSGRVAYAYYDGTNDLLRVAYDRSGDGDFADTVGGTPELVTVATPSILTCLGVSFDDGDRLAMVWAGSVAPQLGRDANGDGDFADAGEVVQLAASPASGCDVDGDPAGGGLAVAHDAGGVQLLLDRDDDGSFTGPDETLPIVAASGTPVRVRKRAGIAGLANGTHFYFDPLLGSP